MHWTLDASVHGGGVSETKRSLFNDEHPGYRRSFISHVASNIISLVFQYNTFGRGMRQASYLAEQAASVNVQRSPNHYHQHSADCSYTYPPLPIARYSCIHQSELEQCRVKQNCTRF